MSVQEDIDRLRDKRAYWGTESGPRMDRIFLETELLMKENERLRAALNYYAHLGPQMDQGITLWDGGQVARDALAADKK